MRYMMIVKGTQASEAGSVPTAANIGEGDFAAAPG